ncbi:MAG: tetratricopeptide repeat protein [Schleiferiaceae bacterium]|nr:tetratricopeptide repeat protein [Schleiferiaceae bacterium]
MRKILLSVSFLFMAFGLLSQDVDSLYNYGREFIVQNNEEGDSLGRKSLMNLIPIAQKAGRKNIEAQIYHLVAFTHERTNKDSAIYYLGIAVERYRELKNPNYIDANNYIGFLQVDAGDFELSLNTFQKSLDYAEAENDSSSISYILGELGYVYDRMEDYNEALKYYRRAMLFANDSGSVGMVYGKTGIAFDELKQYDSAIFYNSLAIQYFEAVGEEGNMSIWQSNLGNTYTKIGEWETALELFNKSLGTYEKYERQPAPFLLVNLGKVHTILGNYDEAKQYLLKGLEYSKNLDLVRSEYEAYYQLSEWYEAQGKSEQALENFKLYSNLKDSVINADRLKSAQELQLKYEGEKKDKELAEGKAQLSEKNLALEKEKTKNLLVAGAFGILVLIGLWYLRVQRLKRKQLTKEFELKTEMAKQESAKNLADEKVRISAELHDNIGSQLTFLVSSVDNLSYVEKDLQMQSKLQSISDFGREAISDLRSTIWAMKEKKADTQTLIERLVGLKSKINPPPSIDLIDQLENEHELSATQILNLYRIIQEAIQNAVKYANANSIRVSFSYESGLTVKIEDDGSGFDIDTAEKGNGLMNMEHRAAAIQAEINVISELNKGTVVEVRCSV